ncbi:cytochrome c peroxidase [Hydrogenivirga sp. 128-5-R1-1]|uniref:cytochrome-c peroxidase n=1 Tax=Hydrogenivirga sp. 128-5-R1-1 TaxID=392423 RepID=UPI00015F36B0|nr:cytochrome c peroxidase [Hydrogenivirga sp. 128-5-R1-1]EDP76342.1 Methylamine utilization protein mauG [Hydrogenivirga sp. 128-5-R1-1]
MKAKGLVLGLAGLFVLLGSADSAKRPNIAPLPDRPPEPKDNPTTPAKVELGKLLYFDPRLSGDGSTSCATCHDPNHGWAKKRFMSPAYPENKHFRHSPTVLNVAYNTLMFWDGRVKTLEEQAMGPIKSPFEMNMNYGLLEERLKKIPKYRELFAKAFPREKDPITIKNIAKAIAAFERTIVCNDSPFDRYMRGEKSAMDEVQVKGMKLFIGKAGCAQCHNGPNFTDDKFHVTGVPKNKVEDDALVRVTRNFVLREHGFRNPDSIDRDLGLYFITKKEKDRGAFKTPTLRNVALTPPYMHNGVLKSLREVVEFYNRGGGNVPNKDPRLKPLNLTEEEKEALVAFLEALTCENVPYVEEPELPPFEGETVKGGG